MITKKIFISFFFTGLALPLAAQYNGLFDSALLSKEVNFSGTCLPNLTMLPAEVNGQNFIHQPYMPAANSPSAKRPDAAQKRVSDTIVIEARVSMSDNDFWVYIYRSTTRIKVQVKMRDSINRQFEADSQLQLCRRFTDTLQDMRYDSSRVWQCVRLYNKLEIDYSYFTNVSLRVKRKKVSSFDSLLTAVFAAPKDSLAHPASSKNIITLDGAIVSFSLTQNGTTRTVSALSPRSDNYPLLGTMVSEAMNMIRKKHNSLLPRKRFTGGY
jgi:hypothetical protein